MRLKVVLFTVVVAVSVVCTYFPNHSASVLCLENSKLTMAPQFNDPPPSPPGDPNPSPPPPPPDPFKFV